MKFQHQLYEGARSSRLWTPLFGQIGRSMQQLRGCFDNSPALACLQKYRDFEADFARRRELGGVACPGSGSEPDELAHDVTVRQRWSAVFASPDRHVARA